MRIAAQRLADGRTEFALQQRQPDGQWGERLRPRARNFPSQPATGRWLVTTPLAVSPLNGAPAATPDGASAVACSAEAAAARVAGSVAVATTSRTQGSAFYIGSSEWLTAQHVVLGETSVQLTNATMDVTATVRGARADIDLAVLVADSSAEPIDWGETPGNGAEALILGYGVGQRTLIAGITSGIVSERYGTNGLTFIRTDAPANPGNSGGPLLDRCGDVIGVIQSKLVGEAVEGVAYALAVDSVRALLPSVRATAGGAEPPALVITAFCNAAAGDTPADCGATAARGLNAGEAASIWIVGVEDGDNVRFSLDVGTPVGWEAVTLEGLAPGRHTIQVIERRAAGWTRWSEPYWFTISR